MKGLWAGVGSAVLVTFAYRLWQLPTVEPDYDDGVYWQTGWALGSGDRIYAEVFHAQPPLFGWLLGLPFHGVGPHTGILLARLLMIAFAVLLALVAAGLATTLHDRHAGLLAALGVAAIPMVQRYSVQLNADVPTAAFSGAALWCALRSRDTSTPTRRRLLLATGAFVALAALTKLIAIVAVPAVLLALMAGRPAGWPDWLRRTSAAAGWSAVGFGATAAVVLLVVRPPTAAWAQVIGFHVDAGPVNSAAGLSRMLTNAGPWSIPLLVAAAIAALVTLLRPAVPGGRVAALAIATWAASVIPFGLAHRPVFAHHLLLFVAPCVVLLAAALSRAVAQTANRRTVDFAGVVPALVPALVIALVAGLVVELALLPAGPPRGAVSMERCLQALPPGLTIVGDDQGLLARTGHRTPPWLVDTSKVRLNAPGALLNRTLKRAAERAGGLLIGPGRRLAGRVALARWLATNRTTAYRADGYALYLRDTGLLRRCDAQA